MRPSDCYFEVDREPNPQEVIGGAPVYIVLVSREYWDENHCYEDEHLADVMEGLPEDWEEIMESTFIVEGFEDNLEGLRDLALTLGFVPLPDGSHAPL
jgi:hypothetical protein